METFLHAGLGNALAAALLAALVAGFGLVARRPALMHALWIVVLLKLITPPLWSVPVGPSSAGVEGASVGPGEPVEPLAVIGEFEAPTAEPVFDAGPQHEVVPPDSAGVVEAPAWRNPPRPETPSRAGTTPTWTAVVASTWVAGTLVTFGIAAVRVRRFGRLLKDARPAPRDVLDRVGELAARLGLSRPPAVRMTPGAVSPMLWALGCRPLLIVPDDLWGRLDEARRDTLLVHELAHLKRRDHWVRGLELLATGLYWWHPVVWWSRRALRESEEQCCDAWVVWAMPGAARTYAEALLDTVDFLSGVEPSVPWAASGLGHVRHLKRRLVMILRGNTPRTLTWAGALATLGLCAVLLPLSPSWGDEPQGSEPSDAVEGRVEQAPTPDRPEENVLKFKFRREGPDKTVIREEVVDVLSQDDSLSNDPRYQDLEKQVSALQSRLAEIQRAVRAPNDPALRAQTKALESAEKKLAAYREKVRVEAGKKIAELDEARAELREQGTELSRKREEFMKAELRYQETRQRLAELERPVRRFTTRVTIPDALNLRGSVTEIRPTFPFPSPGGRPGVSGNRLFGTPEIREMRLLPHDESRRISELEKKLDRVLEEVKGLKGEKASKSE